MPSTNKGAFLCWPGRGWLLLSLDRVLSGCHCLHPTSPTWGRDPGSHPAQGGRGRYDKVPSIVSPGPNWALLLPHLPNFQLGKWEELEDEGQYSRGDVVDQGRMGSLPKFLRELFLRELVMSPLTFGIPGSQAPSLGPPSPASRPNSRLALPKNRRRGCVVLQISSSWQQPGCQGLPELAPAVSMTTGGAPAPSDSGKPAGFGPAALEPCPTQDPRVKFLYTSPLHAPLPLCLP